jgi:hypothetical protein
MVFRHRFHRSEKRDDSNRQKLVDLTLNDFNFTHKSLKSYDHLFYFFYNLHTKMRKEELEDIQGRKFVGTPFEVYDSFTLPLTETFLNDEIGAQLVYFFITNYSETYLDKMKGKYKKEVTKIITQLKSKFSES